MICRSDGVAHVRRRVALVATVAVTPFSVERELDPPATRGDGALAVVSACQLPRRRGRTPLATACAAHFVRGICRHGGRRRMRTDIPSTNYPLPTAIFRSNGRVALVATVAVTPFSVERELDPPASASGRRGLRPSRDTWRWRPRHRICLPAAATARAHPSCDRLRGSLRSGDMSLRGQTTHEDRHTLYQLSSTNGHFT